MYELGHCCRADEKRTFDLVTENGAALIYITNIAHDSRSKRDTFEEFPVPVAGDAISSA